MAAILSGLIVLENAATLEGFPSTVLLDGQMWLGPHLYLKGHFRYYNASRLTFGDVDRYFASISVSMGPFTVTILTLSYSSQNTSLFPLKENRNQLLMNPLTPKPKRTQTLNKQIPPFSPLKKKNISFM